MSVGDSDPTTTELRQQLERMLQAREFLMRSRVARTLRYVVEESILNGFQAINQRLIATHALGLTDDFSPTRNASVRVSIARLRKSLDRYFAGAGSRDPIVFEITPGPYRLVATRNGAHDAGAGPAARVSRRSRPTLLVFEPLVSGVAADDPTGLGRCVGLSVVSGLVESMLVTVSGPLLRGRSDRHETAVAALALALGYDYATEAAIHIENGSSRGGSSGDRHMTVRLAVFDAARGEPVREATAALGPFSDTDAASEAVASWVFHQIGDCFTALG